MARSHENILRCFSTRRRSSRNRTLTARRKLKAELLEDRRLLAAAPTGVTIASTTIIENARTVGELIAIDDDLPNDTHSFSVAGTGPDDSKFEIRKDPKSLVSWDLVFRNSPDFENPTDIGGIAGDNIYEVDVETRDSTGQVATSRLQIEVVDSDWAVPGVEPFQEYHRVFVTSFTTGLSTDRSVPPPFPSFGGIEAASWTTTLAAYNAGLLTEWDFQTPIYRAVLSNSTADAIDHTNIQGPVLNMANELLAIDAQDFFDGRIRASISYSEQGRFVVSSVLDAWSGTEVGGRAGSSTCGNWDEPSPDAADTANPMSKLWLESTATTCGDLGRLIGISPPLIAGFDHPSEIVPVFELGEDAIVELADAGLFERLDVVIKSVESRKPLMVDIDYGDGSPPTQVTLSDAGDQLLDLSHVYATSGTFAVSVQVTDNEGAIAVDSLEVTVEQNAPPVADAGGPYNVDEGGVVVLDGSASYDPDATDSIVSYAWDFDYDGTQFVAASTGASPSFSAATIDGPATRTIALQVTDQTGSSNLATTAISIDNVAPTLSLDPVADIDENGIATLTGSITDPGTLDTFTLDVNWGDPLSLDNVETYSFDASSTGSQAFTLTHRYLDDNPSDTATDTYTITAMVTDDDNHSGGDATSVIVTNVAPTLTVDAVTRSGAEDNWATTLDMLSVSGSFTDPSPLDSHTVIVDWGEIADDAANADDDRDSIQLAASDAREFAFNHQYTTGGIFTVSVTVIDDDGGLVSDSSTQLWVSGVRLDPNSSTLQIVGTSDKDDVKLKSKDRGDTIEVDAKLADEKKQKFEFAADEVGAIEIYLGAGDDKATLDKKIVIGARIDGGAGDDKLKGGGGNDILIGGAGDDKLDGGKGVNILLGGEGDDHLKSHDGEDGSVGDILVGGDGDDKLHGSRRMDLMIGGRGVDDIKGGNNKRGGDILIGGYTTHDADIASLIAIRDIWTSGNDAATLVSQLTGAGGLLEPDQRVFDDDAADKLHGNKKAIDLFFADLDLDDLKDVEEEDHFVWL